MDVFFYEAFEEEQEALKRYLPENIVAGFTGKTIQSTKDTLPPAKVLSIRTQSTIPAAWGQMIDGVLTRSQGFEHLLKYRQDIQRDLACGFLGKYCSQAVAEHAIMLMMMLLRKVKAQQNQFKNFKRDGLTGTQSEGKNALVIGVGSIGKEVVSLAEALKMNVKGVDIDPRHKEVAYVSLDEGLVWADVLFCCLPLTSLTQGLLSFDRLKQAKQGVVLINIARGEITPTGDLRRLLSGGFLGGVGLDVFDCEAEVAEGLRSKALPLNPMATEVLALNKFDNCIFTPHNAFNTQEALEEKSRLSIEAILAFLKTGAFSFPVLE